MIVDLYSKTRGEGEPLVILHGLFGSGDNLGGIARILSESFKVYLLDLRGHGRSPHGGNLNYPDMASDVAAFMEKEGLESAFVFGHSMGGKTAMQLALSSPTLVEKLVVGDISPCAYKHHHSRILEGMRKVLDDAPSDRSGAEVILQKYEDESAVLSFLLTNWRRVSDTKWGWRLDFDAIERDYDNIIGAVDGQPYIGETLFLRGGNSEYLLPEHRETVLKLFPKAQVRTIEGTGHWLHAEKPDMVARAIEKFLKA